MHDPTRIDTSPWRVEGDAKVDLGDFPTRADVLEGRRASEDEVLKRHVEALTQLQDKFYAADTTALLVVLQGMDAAGKDGVIRHVMSGVNPQGCQVTSFKQPSAEELRHDFLWRAARALPARGMIGLFNRSHYEEVLILRVHPELLQAEGREPKGDLKRLWKDRYRSIRHFEAHLARNETRVVKIFLHLSKAEQRRRFLSRIDEPDKNWKLSPADIAERRLWGHYQKAYARAIEATATPEAPWWIVPADHKPSARLIVSQILLDVLEDIGPQWPKTTDEQRARLVDIRRSLTKAD